MYEEKFGFDLTYISFILFSIRLAKNVFECFLQIKLLLCSFRVMDLVQPSTLSSEI